MNKFKASVVCIDRDYRAYVGTTDIFVDSWKEAEEYCKENSWTGEYYYIEFLINLETKQLYYNQTEFNNMVGE